MRGGAVLSELLNVRSVQTKNKQFTISQDKHKNGTFEKMELEKAGRFFFLEKFRKSVDRLAGQRGGEDF